MQSLRSRLIIWVLRHRHLLKMQLKPEVIDDSFSVTDFREGVDKATVQPKMVHAFPILAPMFPDPSAALADICAFARKHATLSPAVNAPQV